MEAGRQPGPEFEILLCGRIRETYSWPLNALALFLRWEDLASDLDREQKACHRKLLA